MGVGIDRDERGKVEGRKDELGGLCFVGVGWDGLGLRGVWETRVRGWSSGV